MMSALKVHLAHKKRCEEVKRKLKEMGILPKADRDLKCPYCGKQYKRSADFEWHVWIHESKFGYWDNGSPSATNIGLCSECLAFVIAPNIGVNHGSTSNLRRDGFTGDIDGHDGKLYCLRCMKKLGWRWGDREKEE